MCEKDLRKVSPKKKIIGSRVFEGTRKRPKALNAFGQRHSVPLRRHKVPLSEKAQSALRQQSAFDLTYLSVIYPSYYPHHRRFHQSEQHNNSPPPPQSTNARQ
jgi:hypothetical protein